MASEEELERRARAVADEAFRSEAPELVAGIERRLLRLETALEPERARLIPELRRAAHTLKGSAGFTSSFQDVVPLAHELEEGLADARADFERLYALVDALARAIGLEREEPSGAGAVPVAVERTTARDDDVLRVSARRVDALLGGTCELFALRVRTDERASLAAALRELADETLAASLRGRDGAGALREVARRALELERSLSRETTRVSILADELHDRLRALRLQPIASLFEPFRRTVRDLAARLGKDASLELSGEAAEVDKNVLDGLREPLAHLVRNAVDHGLEDPRERVATGKPACATIRLAARTQGNVLLVTVEDDGRGLDAERIRAAARERGVVDEARLATLSPADVEQLVFLPGLSTSRTVTELSGRGVGLDAVRERVERLRGHVTVEGRPAKGARFTLSVPVSLATTRALLCVLAGETYALPTASVERIVRAAPSDLVSIDGQDALVVDGAPIGIAHLRALLGIRGPLGEDTFRAAARQPLVVLEHARRRLAVAVDALAGEEEVVVKDLGPHLGRVRGIAGATVLASGDPAPVLDAAALLARAAEAPRQAATAAPIEAPSVLVVDDSLAMRSLERSILEAAGYRVRTARDGVEALSALASSPADLLVTDIDMPNMDGLDLLRAVRHDGRHAMMPVLVVSSHGSPEDRAAGLEAGANGWFSKGDFQHHAFLEAVRRILGS